jgi:type II secretory pathway pseudopilin PulG
VNFSQNAKAAKESSEKSFRFPFKNRYKIRTAFTLAEILLTLLIIGIISSLVIPGIVADTQQAELKIAAKKALAVANQSYKLSVAENGGGYGEAIGAPAEINHQKFLALKAKLLAIKECPYGSGSYGKCWASKGVGIPGNAIDNCSQWSTTGLQNLNYAFVAPDGMYWMEYSYNATKSGFGFAVDVNGAKGPNDWGKDVFHFRMDSTSIRPFPYVCNILKHNDGTDVQPNEFLAPFIN